MTSENPTWVERAENAMAEESVQNGVVSAEPGTNQSGTPTPTLHENHGHHDDALSKKEGLDGDVEAQHSAEESSVMSGPKLYLVFVSLMFCIFMFALDQSIVATAIPVIVSDFHAFDKVGWVITGYFLTQCGLILLAGQLLTVVRAKWTLLGSIFWFELGSLICAVSHSMSVLIFARAVQGIGASGMFVSILAIIAVITRIEQRPAFMASFGFVFVISSVVGPLLGGVFTQHVSWRWCFWINLPFGGVAAAAVVFLLPSRKPSQHNANAPTGWRAMLVIDYLGAALIMCTITCLLLALQWGGNEYSWKNWRIIFLFILGGLLVIAFVAWELYVDENALIPIAIFKNRTVLASSGAMFFFMLCMLGGTYQLPLFYEAVRNHSPTKAGIDIIPYMLAVCIGIFISGGAVTATGRYYWWILVGPPISAAGFGLLYTIDQGTSNPKIIGYQILAGFGIGLSFQNVMMAVQAEYHDRPHLLPQASGVVSFFQLTGAAIGIGIINTVESVYLNKYLHELAPDAPFDLVRQSTEAIYTLPLAQQGPVIEAYVKAITGSLIPIFVAVPLALIFGAFIRNHNMKEKGGAGAAAI